MEKLSAVPHHDAVKSLSESSIQIENSGKFH